MTRHVLTQDDIRKAIQSRAEGHRARKLRREAEMWLLDKLLAEAAQPEWYPHECGGAD